MNEKQCQALMGSVRETGKILCGTAKAVSARTVENCEQHRRKPAGPAPALLRVLAFNRKAVIKALHRPAACGGSCIGIHPMFL